VLRFANSGVKVSRIADPHDLFLLGPDSVLLRGTDVAAAASMTGKLLISEVSAKQHIAVQHTLWPWRWPFACGHGACLVGVTPANG
jgi:hypothetical protein